MTDAQPNSGPQGIFSKLARRFSYLSLYPRIVIGNSIIIVIGAIGGTLLTRKLSGEAASLWLVIFFSLVGVAMIILLNNWIVKKSLQPLNELHSLVDRVAAGQTPINTRQYEQLGPDFYQLSSALNAIVRQLEERNQQLSALSNRAIKSQEEERIRIAHSLHDDTGQSLSSLIILLDRIERRMPDKPADLKQQLAAARQMASSTLAELRKIIFDLRPTILDDLGLVSAIRWYARTYLEPEGVQVRLFMPDEELELPFECSTTLFRICQEAMSNILRHASARMVMITLCVDNTEVCLQVVDDGQGFDMKELSEQGPHPQKLGLLGIKERAELVGGRVIIETAPKSGVRLQVCLPVPGCKE
jgi:two-component system, NarL family, sensor histidine kinase UhpB